MPPSHLLTLDDLGADGIERVLTHAQHNKTSEPVSAPLAGRTLAMVFEKASTRTRVSFETGMTQLGGHAIFLSPGDTQIGRGESVADTARTLSRMVDAVMIRNHSHGVLESFADAASVPIINGLTDYAHPCQLLADLLTFIEHRGAIAGRTVAWIGDANNMCQSYLTAARLLGFTLNIAAPAAYAPTPAMLDAADGRAHFFKSPRDAAAGADLVATDVWASMGDEAEREQRLAAFAGYQVNSAIMREAAGDALFMHCLPAHRDEEVTADVIDGGQSVVWDQAENRLHAQKALLVDLINPT